MAAALINNHHIPERGDWLTGFLTRGDGLSSLSSLLAQAMNGKGVVGILWINIDRFRKINHSFGHSVGDSVLIELSRRLERIRPSSGLLARMAGDEFVLMFACQGADEAESLAGAVQQELGRPLVVDGHTLHPSLSLGVAVSRAGDGAGDLLERADRLMREAKRHGGGQYCMQLNTQQLERGVKVLAQEELSVEALLHRSLEYGGLYLEYQPIVGISDGRPIAIEALMRCRVDDQNIPPGRFIPVAEKAGLIIHLGDWSLSTAATYARRLEQQGTRIKVAVNVSRAQLLMPAYSKILHGVMTYTGVAPSQLELELTESLFMDTSDVVKKNLQAIIDVGISLALDDFGTGHSSLACLKDLPADKIKLDRAFVTGLPHDRRSFNVAKAVAQLATDLDITLVAEGVETKEQYDALQEAGVAAVQGYYVARPMSEAALEEWFARGAT